MRRRNWLNGWLRRHPAGWLALALLFGSSIGAGCASTTRPPCVEQSDEALIEIATGQLEDHAPFVAAWEREQARACGWVRPEDHRDAD